MDHSEKFEEDREKLRTKTVQGGLKKREDDSLVDTEVDTEVAHCEDNQESAPSPPEQQQEVRNRVSSKVPPGQEPGLEQKSEPEGSNNESSEVQKPGKSDCKPVQSLFQDMLKLLQKLFKDVLECVQHFASFVKKMETIRSDIEKLYSSAAKCFPILCEA